MIDQWILGYPILDTDYIYIYAYIVYIYIYCIRIFNLNLDRHASVLAATLPRAYAFSIIFSAESH